MAAKKKPGTEPMTPYLADLVTLEVHDGEARSKYPILTDLLLPRYDGGKLVRQEGSLRIQPRGSVWSVQLDIPSDKVQASYDVESLVDVLGQLEVALAAHKLLWRESYKKRKKDLQRLDRPVQ